MNLNENGMGGRHEQERDQLVAYHELLNFVNTDMECSSDEREALAFIVEDAHQKESERWKLYFADFIEKFHHIREQGGTLELTWRLSEEFYTRYDTFLVELERLEQNPIRLNNIKVLRDGDKRNMELRRKIHEAGRSVPIGSIISEHVPKWFPSL